MTRNQIETDATYNTQTGAYTNSHHQYKYGSNEMMFRRKYTGKTESKVFGKQSEAASRKPEKIRKLVVVS